MLTVRQDIMTGLLSCTPCWDSDISTDSGFVSNLPNVSIKVMLRIVV
jgi:hypothetical protein